MIALITGADCNILNEYLERPNVSILTTLL